MQWKMESNESKNRIEESNHRIINLQICIEHRARDRETHEGQTPSCSVNFMLALLRLLFTSLTSHSFNESQVRVGLDGGGERGCRIGRQTRPMHFLYHFGLTGVVVRAPYPSDQRQTRAVSATIAWLAVLHELSGSINIICCVLHSSQLSALPFGISPSRLFVI